MSSIKSNLKMKKFKLLHTLMIVIMFMFSCQDLEEDLSGTLVTDSFFKTEADLQAAVTATYYPLVSQPWNGFGSTRIWVPLMGADDLTTLPAGNKQDFKEFDNFSATAVNGAARFSGWLVPYQMVYAANNVLQNYEKVNGSEQVINEAVAQVRFLRAFAYFWMVRIYGELPLITDVTPDLTIARSPVSEVYDLIVEDLTFAEEHLPEAWPGNPGRPTVWAAKGLLAQVYLTMAGWPLKDESKYVLAAEKAKEVIDNSPHQLLENFAELWPIAADNNAEVVWSIQFCSITNCSSPYLSTHGGQTTQPSEEGGWDDVFFEVGFYNRFPEGPRKDATFHVVFTDSTHFENSVTGHPYIAKYRSGAIPGEEGFQHRHMTSRDLKYLRFAEVLLIYAEAQAMANSPDASAYEAINRVRNRAGLDDLQPGLDNMAFRDAVIEERGWELAAEFSRWFDLVRTEKVEAMNAYKAEKDMKPVNPITKDKYLAPIPYSETLLNTNLTQNTGYE